MLDFIQQDWSQICEKRSKFVNIVFVLQTRIERNDAVNHIFIDVWIDVDLHKHSLRIMIDFDVIENFVNQLKIKKFSFQNELSLRKELKTFNETSLRMYHAHNVRFEISNSDDHIHNDKDEFIEINMNEIEMILELSWLQIVNSNINWMSQTWRRRKIARASRARNLCARYNESQITSVNAIVFRKFCMKDDFQTYIIQATMFSLNASDKQAISNNFVEMKLSFQYIDLAKVFNEKITNILFEHDSQNLAIDTQNINSSFESFYNLSEKKFKTFKEYLDKHLQNEFIIFSKSICAALILFIKKKTNDLRLCVDYRELNAIIVKNRYFLSLINETFDRIVDVKYFIKLDIIAAYNKLCIKKKNEWKTAFRTRYDMYEYKIVSFEFANASTTFQTYINVALRKYFDVFAFVYINDIFIFSKILEKHETHMRVVLKRLLQYKLYVNIKKSKFNVVKTTFLSFIIIRDDVKMNSSRIEIIVNWLKSHSHKNVQIFLKFVNFYKRFIKEFFRVADALFALLKKSDKNKFYIFFEFISDAKKSFEKFWQIFFTASLLRHFDSNRKIKFETNASNFVISKIISQLNETIEQWHFIIY